MRILGLDVGDKRIGVALSDPLGILSSALTVIERKEDNSEIDTIMELLSKHSVERIVVGLPRLMNGSYGEQAEKTKVFAEQLEYRAGVPIEMHDERLSTSVADQLMRDAGKNRQQRKQNRDSAAATLILQWYLDEHREEEHLA